MAGTTDKGVPPGPSTRNSSARQAIAPAMAPISSCVRVGAPSRGIMRCRLSTRHS
jgi:hypothetical protein